MLQDIIQTARNATSDATIRKETAGFSLEDSSPLTLHSFNADVAQKILNAVGAGNIPRDGLNPYKEKLELYISSSVLSLASVVAVQSGLEYIALGSESHTVPMGNKESRLMLPFHCLAFAATLVSRATFCYTRPNLPITHCAIA